MARKSYANPTILPADAADRPADHRTLSGGAGGGLAYPGVYLPRAQPMAPTVREVRVERVNLPTLRLPFIRPWCLP